MSVYYTSLITVGLTWLLTVISPGPNFLLTVNTSLNHSNKMGIMVASGIALGTITWALLSMLGISILFHHFHFLRQFIVILGALYLFYLGLTALKKNIPLYKNDPPALHQVKRYLLNGYLVDLSNPKAALFFTSLFAVAIPAHGPLWFKLILLVEIGTIAFIWYSLVACLMHHTTIKNMLFTQQKIIQYIVALFFIALAVYFIFAAFYFNAN